MEKKEDTSLGMWIPTIGDELTLAKPWRFSLHSEHRNADMMKFAFNIKFSWDGTKGPDGKKIDYPAIIIGCDSTFDVDGESFGKPGNAEVATSRAQKISGRSGLLHTGHCIIDTEKGKEIADRVTTKVTFSKMSDAEIADYVASGEPLQVAGGFTLDGFGSPFIPHIEGDYTNVVGISMPFLRSALAQLGYAWPQVKE